MQENEIFNQLMCGVYIHNTIKSPSFQLYVEKFLVGTIGFNSSCTGAYILLLCHQWDLFELPKSNDDLIEIARCNEKDLEKVLKKFTLCKDGKYRNEKLEKIRAEQLFKRNLQTNRGKTGAIKRWGDEKKEPEKHVSINTANNSGYFFYIGTKMFSCKISDYIKESMSSFLNVWQIQKKPTNVDAILAMLDKENVGKSFSNEQHIKNTLSKTFESSININKKFFGTTTTLVASVPKSVKRD